MSRLIAVIPAFNEAASVAEVVRGVQPYVAEVVVVDDGSSDDTAATARAVGALVIRHAVNRGYGAALVTGTTYAFRRVADVVVHLDADGQFDPADIARLVAALPVNGVALGSRFLGKTIGMPLIRRLTLKLAIIFTWAMSGLKLTDAHNGLRAFTRAAWQQFRFRQDRMAFSSEVIDELARTRLPWVEVPVTVRYTAASLRGSKQGKLPALRIAKDLFLGRIVK